MANLNNILPVTMNYQYEFVNQLDEDKVVYMYLVQGLIHSTEIDQVLSLGNAEYPLPANAGLMGEGSCISATRMFVRACYDDLIGLINSAHDRNALVVISGTPGVGKTLMRNVLLKRLLLKPFSPEENNSRTIILQQGGAKKGVRIVLVAGAPAPAVQPEPVQRENAEEQPIIPVIVPVVVPVTITVSYHLDVADLACRFNQRSYYLVDCTKGGFDNIGPLKQCLHKTVLISSPNQSLESSFLTKQFGLRYFVPLWTVTELREADVALELGIGPDTVEDRFQKVGGVVRHVFAQDQAWFNQTVTINLAASIEAMDMDAVLPRVGGVANHRVRIPPFAVHHKTEPLTAAGTTDYARATQVWGSKYLGRMVTRIVQSNVVLRLKQETEAFLPTGTREASASVGHLVEFYANYLLELSGLGNLQYKFMDGKRKFTCTFPMSLDACKQYCILQQLYCSLHNSSSSIVVSVVHRAFRLQYVPDAQMDDTLVHAVENTILIPLSFSYPAIDSVLVVGAGITRRYLLVQVTSARTHSVGGAQAAQRLKAMLAACGGSDRAAIAFFVPPSCYEHFKPQELGNTSSICQFKLSIFP